MAALIYARFHQRLLQLAIPEKDLHLLYLHYLKQIADTERDRYRLIPLLGEMASRKIPTIVLKGAYLAEVVYTDPAWRSMGDIDLLVHQENLEPAVDVLKKSDYLPTREFYLDIELQGGHELPPFIIGGATQVELHWRLFDPFLAFDIDMETLWERARPFDFGGQPALGLSPEDLILYLCMHAAHHRLRNGLRALYDIGITSAHFAAQIDWSTFVQRAREWAAQKAAFLLLWLATEMLQAPIPEWVVEDLRPDDFSKGDADLAYQLVLNLPCAVAFMPPHLAQLAGTRGFSASLKLIWNQLFLPVQVMRRTYHLQRAHGWYCSTTLCAGGTCSSGAYSRSGGWCAASRKPVNRQKPTSTARVWKRLWRRGWSPQKLIYCLENFPA